MSMRVFLFLSGLLTYWQSDLKTQVAQMVSVARHGQLFI